MGGVRTPPISACLDGYDARVTEAHNKETSKAQQRRLRTSKLLATCRRIPLEGMRVGS